MRRRFLFRLGTLGVTVLGSPLGVFAQRDPVGRLVDVLGTARSFKVRLQALALLARNSDPRAHQAIGRAAVSDRHPMVRKVALRILAKNPGGATLSGGKAGRRATLVAIGNMGDRTGRSPRVFRDRMRVELRLLLEREPAVKIAEASAAPGVSYIVDGTISKLDLATGGPDVEAVCAVDLVVSRPPRGIVTVASGEAVVQKPRRQFQVALREKMLEEALENALRSAHENLARFLAAH